MLFIVEVPTPQRTPVFNRLAAEGLGFGVIYLHAESMQHGWGELDLEHPHVFAERDTLREVVAWVLAGRNSKVLACFGHRGVLRSAALAASRLRRSVTVVTRSDSNRLALAQEPGLKSFLRKWHYRLAYPRSTRVWVVGEENRRFWTEYVGRANAVLIPYSTPQLPDSMGPVAPRPISEPDRLAFLFVGRLIEIKGVHHLIEAFARTADRHPRWTLTLVGDGPLRAELERLASGDPRVRFAGAVEYRCLDRYYTASDVLVLPSRSEPWGLVVNEAKAFGLRVVVSDRVGAKDILDPDTDAVYPHGDVSALAKKLSDSVHFRARVQVPPSDPSTAMLADLHSLGVS